MHFLAGVTRPEYAVFKSTCEEYDTLSFVAMAAKFTKKYYNLISEDRNKALSSNSHGVHTSAGAHTSAYAATTNQGSELEKRSYGIFNGFSVPVHQPVSAFLAPATPKFARSSASYGLLYVPVCSTAKEITPRPTVIPSHVATVTRSILPCPHLDGTPV
jgi:hypothetical protein